MIPITRIGSVAHMAGTLSLAVLLAFSSVYCAPSGAEAVIARYYRAIGGRGKLESIRSRHMVGTHFEKGMTIQFDFAWRRPDIRRVDWRLDPNVYGAEGFDGRRAWEIAVGESLVRTLGGVKADAARRGAEFDESFVDYRAKGHRVELIGREKLDERDVDHLRVTLADGWIKDYYLDTKTGLIAALSKSMPVHGEGGAVASLTRYGDYRSVAGVLMPYAAEERDAQTGEVMSSDRWKSIEVNVEIPEDQLRPPAPPPGEVF